MIIKQIDAKDTYTLRHQILRPNHPLEACYFAGDHHDDTFHLGAYVDDELVSIASFYLENNPQFDDLFQYRLRGMATHEKFRHQGLSKALLKSAFPQISKNNVTLLWCNARQAARGFYEKVGFTAVGELFDIPDVGPHFLMFWRAHNSR